MVWRSRSVNKSIDQLPLREDPVAASQNANIVVISWSLQSAGFQLIELRQFPDIKLFTAAVKACDEKGL